MRIIFLALFGLTSMAHAAGLISGGGEPPYIEPPKDPFLYVCKATLAEQRTVGPNTCYAEVISEYRFANKDLNPNDHVPTIDIETSNADKWSSGHTWDGCSVDKQFLDGQRIGLTFGRNPDNSSNVRLDVTAVRASDSDVITASSTSAGNFSSKTISVNATLAHFPKQDGSKIENLILDLRVDCTNVTAAKGN